MRCFTIRYSLLIVGLLLACASPSLAKDSACQPERVTTDRPRITTRIPISEIQDDLQNLLTSGSKVVNKLDPISFSNTTGAIRVSGSLALPAGKLLAKLKPAGDSTEGGSTDTYAFNISFRPSVVNECGQTYIAIEFLRVSLEQNDLLGFFPIVQNLALAVLDDDAVKSYIATFLAKPFGLLPDGVGELLDRQSIEVDAEKKTVRLRVDLTQLAAELIRSQRVSANTKRIAANPAILKELSELRLWGFSPEITRSTGDNGPGYEPEFLLELGRGVPNADLRAFMDKRQAADREFVKQATSADLEKYGNPAALIQARSALISDAKAKLAGKGALGPLELRQIAALETEIDGDIKAGLKADNPLFYGDPEAQVRDLTASMTAKVQSLFDQLGRDRQMTSIVENEASQLKPGERPFVEQRTSEQTLQQFVHFSDGVSYKDEPVFRDLTIRLNAVMNEVTLKGLLHINIPAWTAGFLDSKVAEGVSGVLGNYLPFQVVGKLVFTPQGELLFNLQTLSIDLPDAPNTKPPLVIKRGNKAGYELFDSVEWLLASTVVPRVMGVGPTQKLALDTLKATQPVKRGDMIVLNLDITRSPLYAYVPEVAKDLRFWRVGMHDSRSVGRSFLELAAGSGPVSQSYWKEQDARQAEAIKRLQAKDAGQGGAQPKDILIDMQLRLSLPELKRRVNLLLKDVTKTTQNLLEKAKKESKFAVVVVPDPLTVDFPGPAELDQIAENLLEHARKRDPDAQKETLTDTFKLNMKATGTAVHVPWYAKLLTLFKDTYTFKVEAELYLKLSLIPVEKFTGDFERTPLYLGEQLFEVELVHGSARVTEGKLAKLAGWGAKKVFDIDDADFQDPKSVKLKNLILSFVFPHIDNPNGTYLVHRAGSGATETFYHLNSYLRFFSTDERFALQLNSRLFSPYIDLQISHPVDPKRGEKEVLFEGKKIGLRIDNSPDVNQISLDCAMRPTLAGVDEVAFARIVKDAGNLLSAMIAAVTPNEFLKSLHAANLNETFLKPLFGKSEYTDRSIVARLHRLTLTYPFLSRHGNAALFEAPEGLGTGIDTVTYAKTLIQIEGYIDQVIATAKRLGIEQQAMADPAFRAFIDRHSGKKGDGSDGIQRERIEPLLATYREKFLERNKAVLASPSDSDWTKHFRAEAERAQKIYNEISR